MVSICDMLKDSMLDGVLKIFCCPLEFGCELLVYQWRSDRISGLINVLCDLIRQLLPVTSGILKSGTLVEAIN